jgi:hypothetical protein
LKEKEDMSDDIGWYAIELTDELRKQGTFHNIRSEFIRRYYHLLGKPKTALLLSNWNIDDPSNLPSVPCIYLSPAGVQMMSGFLPPYPLARDCPKPSAEKSYFVIGDEDYFRGMQASDKDKGESKSD